MKIYVASSWRNTRQPEVVQALREAGHDVYDFKQPAPGDNGFHWTEIDGGWKSWTPERFVAALAHPIAEAGYEKDMGALERADVCVMVMPCGRSASLETGYAIGAGKPTFILLSDGEPELMFKMAQVCLTLPELIERVNNCCHYEAKGGFNVPTMETCAHR
jgi:nucleoside 2-deoxyribosyltransferase